MLNHFFSPITFSITGEDHRVIERALHVAHCETVLCIASAGDTPLNLLRLDPGQVDAVDISFPQICLSALKAAAMRRLDLDEFKTLVGVVHDPPRALEYYESMRPDLAPEVRDFWDGHRYLLRRGVLWQGGIQRLIRLARGVLRLALGRKAVEALAQVAGPDEADAFYREYMCTWRFRCFFRLAVNRWTYRMFYPQAGFRHLPPGMTPQEFSLLKVRDIVLRRAPANNPYLFPLLFGRYPSEECVPPYLSAAEYDTIRARLGRLNLIHADVRDHLHAAASDSIDAFALSNTADWIGPSGISSLLGEVVRVAKGGARVLVLSRSTPVEIPPALRANLVVEPDLAALLAAEDRTGYYPFIGVLKVRK